MILVKWVTPKEGTYTPGVAGIVAARHGVRSAVGELLGTSGDDLRVFSCLFLPGLVFQYQREVGPCLLEC